jgi:hypothetical protein
MRVEGRHYFWKDVKLQTELAQRKASNQRIEVWLEALERSLTKP